MAPLAETASTVEVVRAISALVGLLLCSAVALDTWQYAHHKGGFEHAYQRFRLGVELLGCLAQAGFLVIATRAMLTPDPVLADIRQLADTNGLLLVLVQNCVTFASVLG